MHHQVFSRASRASSATARRGAGMSSSERADDAGSLERAARASSIRHQVIIDGRVVDTRTQEYADICARRAARVEAAREYREALDAQVRERAGSRARAEFESSARVFNSSAHAAHERARREREMRDAVRARDAYVAALDRQVCERRERERRRIEEDERWARDIDERVRRAVEEERAQLEEKRAAMMRMAEFSGNGGGETTSARSPRVLHSPPASPRWSPKAPTSSDAYEAIPEPSSTRARVERVTVGDYDDDGDDDELDGDDFGDLGQETTVEELLDVIRDLVVEQRALRRRCELAESALASRQHGVAM